MFLYIEIRVQGHRVRFDPFYQERSRFIYVVVFICSYLYIFIYISMYICIQKYTQSADGVGGHRARLESVHKERGINIFAYIGRVKVYLICLCRYVCISIRIHVYIDKYVCIYTQMQI